MAFLPDGLSTPLTADSYASQVRSICASILEFEFKGIEQPVSNKAEISNVTSPEILLIVKVYVDMILYGTIKELSGPRIEHVTL